MSSSINFKFSAVWRFILTPLTLVFLFNISLISHSEVLKVGVINAPPMGIPVTNNGILFELGKLIGKEAGYSVESEFLPYPRILGYIKSGKVDFTLLFSNDELRNSSKQVAPIMVLKSIIVGKKGTPCTSLDDLKGKNVGTLRGSLYTSKLSEIKDIALFELNTYEQMIEMLKLGRLDAISGTKSGISYLVHELGYSKDISFDEYIELEDETVWVHVSNKVTPSVQDKIRLATISIKNSNIVNQIVNKYISQTESTN